MGTGRKVPPDEVIIELYKSLSISEIARRSGVTFRAIWKHVHRLGLPPPPKPINEAALIQEDIQKVRVEEESWKQKRLLLAQRYRDWVYCQNGACKNHKRHDPKTMTMVRMGSAQIGKLKYCPECSSDLGDYN